jgi:hypothetical protein
MENKLNRRQMIGGTCGMGLCSCLGAILPGGEAIAEEAKPDMSIDQIKEQNRKLSWWADHSKKQLTELWRQLEPHLDEKKRNDIIEQLGRNCARSLGWAKKYKGDPEGFFKHMKQSGNEDITYDKEHGIISVVGPEHDCVCGMVNSKITPAYFCNCSKGWQKETYETILGKQVDCEIVESVLYGGKRCVFKITIK